METGRKYQKNLESIFEEIITEAKLSGKSIFDFLDDYYCKYVVKMNNTICYKCLNSINEEGVFVVRREESALESGKHFISKNMYFFHFNCFHTSVFCTIADRDKQFIS